MGAHSSGEPLLTGITDHLRSVGFSTASSAVILGSGLGTFASRLDSPITVHTAEIPGYPPSTVPGHAGKIHFARIWHAGRASDPCIVFQGRIHPYEGGEFSDASLNVRIAAHFGARVLIVTNAAGGIRPAFQAGDLMLHTDLMRLPIPSRWHESMDKNVGLSAPGLITYTTRLNALVQEIAHEIGVQLYKGTYCYLPGPVYETPAEVRMLRILGADAVGMSTYPEVTEAVTRGLEVAGISLISNLAAGLSESKLSHADVTKVAEGSGGSLGGLLAGILAHSQLGKT